MYIGYIAGFAFLPVSVLLFLNEFKIINLTSIFGISMMLIAAIGIIIIEIGDIIHSHFTDEHIIMTWIYGFLLMLPAFVYFLSFLIEMPSSISASLPLIVACFLFVEGISSFFIGS